MKSSKDALKRKVDELQKQAEEIEELGVKFLEEVTFEEYFQGGGHFKKPDYHSPLSKLQRETILKYQQWYSVAQRLVEEYAPEWLEKFRLCYSSKNLSNSYYVLDCLELTIGISVSSRENVIAGFAIDFGTQLSIVLSIPHVVEVKEFGLRELITADVARTEIEQAEVLLENGFERAAGSIAGVALELYLKTQCDVNGISYPTKPTIEPLIQALYAENKLDISEKKRLEYLGSIRNKCSHSEPVTEKEVKRLIEEVKKLI